MHHPSTKVLHHCGPQYLSTGATLAGLAPALISIVWVSCRCLLLVFLSCWHFYLCDIYFLCHFLSCFLDFYVFLVRKREKYVSFLQLNSFTGKYIKSTFWVYAQKHFPLNFQFNVGNVPKTIQFKTDLWTKKWEN